MTGTVSNVRLAVATPRLAKVYVSLKSLSIVAVTAALSPRAPIVNRRTTPERMTCETNIE